MNQDSESQKVHLKNPLVAAVLSFLLPGAGHFYQGRNFKGTINCVCVLTLLFWGLRLGEWGIVFRLEPTQLNAQDFARVQEGFRDDQPIPHPNLEPDRDSTKLHLGFLAQAPIGLISIPAMIQEKRYFSSGNLSATDENLELNESASGKFIHRSNDGELVVQLIEGTLQMSPQQGDFGREMQGTYSGTDPQGKTIELTVRGLNSIGPPIGSERYRPLSCFVTHLDGQPIDEGLLLAGIERSWINRFLVPPNFVSLEHLHGQLGKKFPLAEVFTWIAGLLNILVIWDAYAGPAYGYRMPRPEELKEDEEKDKNKDKADAKNNPPPKPDALKAEDPKPETSKPTPRTA